jgi:hypothetical protein
MHHTQRILSLAIALAGCTTDAGESMIIVQNQIAAEECIVPSSRDATFRGRGIIDVQAGEGYIFTPLVQSLLEEDESGRTLRVVAVRGADVDVSFPSGFFSNSEEAELEDDRLTRFSQAFSGSLFPGGLASFAFVVIPRGLLDRVDAKLDPGEQILATVDVVVFGEIDGGDVESVPFSYPIDVCDDCLKIDRGACSALSPDFEPLTGGVCNPLQDAPVDCCTEGAIELCPAQPPAA